MSAARHIHPAQLAMFQPAHRLANPEKVIFGDQEPWQSHTELRQEKVEESKRGGYVHSGGEMVAWDRPKPGEPTFHEDIKKSGVKTPITMSHHPDDPAVQWLIDGHHRVFSANEHNPNMEVPVTYE